MSVGVVGVCGCRQQVWVRAVWAGWCMGVDRVYDGDGVRVRSVGGVPGVGVDDGNTDGMGL